MKLREIKEKFANQKISKQEYINEMHELHSLLFDYTEFIKSSDIAKIEITDNGVEMTSREAGLKIICDKDDKRMVPIEILNFNYYEKTDSDMIFRLVNNGDTILDIGANIGWYSMSLAKKNPECEIKSFEPIPKTYEYLKKNIKLNLLPNIETYNHGFSNENNELTFYYYPAGSGNASLAKLADCTGLQEVKCPVVPLDTFIVEHEVKVDFIKCDVEGAELFVFQGGLDTLKRCKPIVFTEMLRKFAAKFNYHPNEIIKLFFGIGYHCFVAQGDKLVEFSLMDEETLETNFFFLHSEKHIDIIDSLT